MDRLSITITILVGLLLGGSGFVSVGGRMTAPVPGEYQQLYLTLKASLDGYERSLNSRGTDENFPVIFGAELIPANSNRGIELLTPRAMLGVVAFLDRFRELGVHGVTFPVAYPLYTPGFPRYAEYVRFYKQVVAEVRKRGMVLSVESAVIFANTPFSPLNVSYAGLTFDRFKTERRQMVATLIRDLKPDYLNLGAEPDTEYQLLGLRELNSADKYAEYVNYVLDGLDRGGTKIGAGIGTWGNIEYVNALAKTSLDSIHIHVYPVTGRLLQNILTISNLAHQNGKRVVLDEAWLYKVDKPVADGVAASPETFRRDVFSFWAALDQQFLGVIIKSAQIANIEYVSPFWTTFFFAYVDYDPAVADLPYRDLSMIVNRLASMNIQLGKFTSTGEFYGKLITANISPTTTSSTLTTPAGSAFPTAITTSATTGIEFRPRLLPIAGIIFGVAIVVLGLIEMRRRSRRRKTLTLA